MELHSIWNYDNFLLTSRGGGDDKTDIYCLHNNCTVLQIGLIADQVWRCESYGARRVGSWEPPSLPPCIFNSSSSDKISLIAANPPVADQRDVSSINQIVKRNTLMFQFGLFLVVPA